jgi:hypothetical protein
MCRELVLISSCLLVDCRENKRETRGAWTVEQTQAGLGFQALAQKKKLSLGEGTIMVLCDLCV